MRALLAGVAMAAGLTLGCSRPPVDPLQLDRNILTVDNRTSQDWTSVEIWLKKQFNADGLAAVFEKWER